MPDATFAGRPIDAAVRIAERPAPGMVTLRGDLALPALAAALRTATDCAVPAVRRIVFAGDRAAAWMSPDELMLFLPPDAAPAAVAALSAALEGHHHLAANVSDARTVFRLEGPGAREVIAKGAPADLAPAAFGPGDFRRTRLAQVAAAFWMDDSGALELMCFRSVGGLVADWLGNAAAPGSLPGYLRA